MSAAHAGGRDAKEKPNILLIMTDEHDYAVTGCYGDDIVDTRHIDGLARRGITFDGCYTPSPLCVPARLSFTAGQYASRCGAWSNDCWLPSADYPSLPRILNEAGYTSVLGGKMHYDTTRRYGFTDLFPSRPHQNSWFKTGRGDRRQAFDTTTTPDDHPKSWKYRIDRFHPGEQSWVMDLDREVTAECSDFIRSRTPEDPPFFLLAGYYAPHFPLIVPEAYFAKYHNRVPPPHVPEGFLETLPLNYQHLRRAFGLLNARPEDIQKGRELYWGFVDWIDDQIGQLLGALEASAVADNTVVIYTSDHGENKGDHGMWWKCCMYEASARVPLIVSWPNRFKGGQRRKGACSLLDLVHTIAAIAGATVPDNWDGDSMLNWMANGDLDWKDCAVSEYYAHFVVSGFAMYRQEDFKYVYHTRMDETHGPQQELYHLGDDQDELCNLAGDARFKSRLEEMHAQLAGELGRDPEDAEMACRSDYARGYQRKPDADMTRDDPLFGR